MIKLANILLLIGWIGVVIQIINPFGLNVIIYPIIIVPIFIASIVLRRIKIKPKYESNESKYEKVKSKSIYESRYKKY